MNSQPAVELGNQAEGLDIPVPVNSFISVPQSNPSRSGHPHDSQPKVVLEVDSECDDELDLNQCFNPDCKVPAYLAPGGLKKCTRCSFALYCGRECQAKHWKLHRTFCLHNSTAGKILS